MRIWVCSQIQSKLRKKDAILCYWKVIPMTDSSLILHVTCCREIQHWPCARKQNVWMINGQVQRKYPFRMCASTYDKATVHDHQATLLTHLTAPSFSSACCACHLVKVFQCVQQTIGLLVWDSGEMFSMWPYCVICCVSTLKVNSPAVSVSILYSFYVQPSEDKRLFFL